MVVTIRLENNYSFVQTQDKEIKDSLWKVFRIQSRGYYHNVRYKMKLWDGYNEFFKRETGRFLTGLLPEVKMALKHFKVPYNIIDNRGSLDFLVDKIDENFLGEPKLRDYQVDYVNLCLKNKRAIIPSPTSSGKTFMMVALLKCLMPTTPTLILANRKQLVEQNYGEIIKYGIKNVGRFYGDIKEPNVITCSTVQSAKQLEPLFPKIKVLIVDEIHEMVSRTPKQVYSKLKNACMRIGMSATAFKFGGTDKEQKFDVKGWIGPLLISSCTETGILTTKELQNREILASCDCIFYKINKPKLEYEIYIDAVTKGIAENDFLNNAVCKLVSKIPGRTLIIVERLEHGDRLQKSLPGSLWIRGEDKMEIRQEVIDKLRNEEDDMVAIATQGIFNTGVSVFCHNLINAAGGQAEHQIIQRFGRGLRVATDKRHLKYFDFYFTNNEYLEKHSKHRVKILKKEGHKVEIRNLDCLDNDKFE